MQLLRSSASGDSEMYKDTYNVGEAAQTQFSQILKIMTYEVSTDATINNVTLAMRMTCSRVVLFTS